MWTAILLAAVGCYLLKLVGLSVPESVLARPVVRRTADLLPVAMLAALIGVQVFSSGSAVEVDARFAALLAAAAALLLRAPFLVVVAVAAVTAAALRLV